MVGLDGRRKSRIRLSDAGLALHELTGVIADHNNIALVEILESQLPHSCAPL